MSAYAEHCKFAHGGRRPGSGRKKLYRIPVLLRLSPKAHEALRQAAERSNLSPSHLVESLLLATK